MKTILSTLLKLHFFLTGLVFFLPTESLVAQTGCPEISFYTQSQVDSFPINYPGCTTILGSLNIYSNDILSLDSLYPINIIKGDLILGGYNNFHGLHNIDSIYGSLAIQPDYGNVTAFDSLKYIGHDLDMSWSDATTVPGFPALNTVAGDLNIYANQFLVDMSGLSNLTYVKERLILYYNMVLTSLTGLENLQSDSLKEISIFGNPLLSTCNQPFLCEILANPVIPINIYQNAPDCNNPAVIANACGVSFASLPFGNYYITTQNEAEDFGNLYPGVTTINGGLTVTGDDITSLPGLIGITAIDGYFAVGPTENLINFSGLDSLKVITGGMQIGWWEGSHNNALQNFEGLGNLSTVGRVEVINNQSLESFEGLANLRKMGMTEIIYNDNLISLDGLNKLDTINGDCYIGGNPLLTDLSGLINVKRIIGYLDIGGSDQLSTLHGLDSAQMDNLSIRNNPLLSECDIKSICNLLATPGSWAFISDNATGCNSREEVEEACLVSIDDISGFENQVIYPNPVTDYFRLNVCDNKSPINITVYNLSGQALLSKSVTGNDNWVNVSTLPKGIYVAKLEFSESKVSYSKFIK